MVRLFDSAFWIGTLLVGAAMLVALAALNSSAIPIIGSGRGALLAVAALGIAACTIAGVGQAPSLGLDPPGHAPWRDHRGPRQRRHCGRTLGWAPVLQPVAGLVPGSSPGAPIDTVRVAIVAVAGLVAVKWLIAVGLAAYERLT